jgi:hypothetical protein
MSEVVHHRDHCKTQMLLQICVVAVCILELLIYEVVFFERLHRVLILGVEVVFIFGRALETFIRKIYRFTHSS